MSERVVGSGSHAVASLVSALRAALADAANRKANGLQAKEWREVAPGERSVQLARAT